MTALGNCEPRSGRTVYNSVLHPTGEAPAGEYNVGHAEGRSSVISTNYSVSAGAQRIRRDQGIFRGLYERCHCGGQGR